MDDFELAYLMASKYHRGQFYGSEPYINHLTRVANSVKEDCYGTAYQVTALLHDILEDTECKPSEIIVNFGADVYNAVLAMTHKSGMSYNEYILKQVCLNDIAKIVKFYDVIDNLSNSVLNKEKRNLKEKYIGALHLLTFGY